MAQGKQIFIMFMDGSKGSMTAERYFTTEGMLMAFVSGNTLAFPLSNIKQWAVMVTPSEHGPGFVFEGGSAVVTSGPGSSSKSEKGE